jgi:hypothetical protein
VLQCVWADVIGRPPLTLLEDSFQLFHC